MLKEYVVDKGAFGLELKQGRRTIYTYITPQIRDGGEMTARGLMIEALAADRDRLAAENEKLEAERDDLRRAYSQAVTQLRQLEGLEALAEVAPVSASALDAELREMGFDPDALNERARAIVARYGIEARAALDAEEEE